MIAFLILFNIGCKKNTSEPVETLALTVEDISCTEAWVKITTTNYQTPNTLTLFVNDKADQSITLVRSDTLLYVDSLLPNQSYKIKAAFVTNNQQQTTNEVIAKTMDTTSHNFSWQTFTFGEGSNSLLYDVAIIDENNIWAVGEIYMTDSLGNPDPHVYNAIHWGGNKWELKRIPISFNGTPFYPVIKSVFAFNNNDVWFEAGIHWDGNSFSQVPFNIYFPSNVNKLWGTSSIDLYAVGNTGNTAHYDGNSWQKIESGTITNINDIWGFTNVLTNEYNLYCAVSNVFESGDYKILSINKNGKVDSLKWSTGRRVHSIWTNNGFVIYTSGGGVLKTSVVIGKKLLISPYTIPEK